MLSALGRLLLAMLSSFYSARYSSEYPKVIIHPLDTTKAWSTVVFVSGNFCARLVQFRLVMSEVKTFHLMALTRTARDLIALTIRCFHAKKCSCASCWYGNS